MTYTASTFFPTAVCNEDIYASVMFFFYNQEKYSGSAGILQTSVPAVCFFTLVAFDVSNQIFCMVSVLLSIEGMDW